MRSLRSKPRFSPLMVMRVPGGPSLGDTPVTSGWFLGAIVAAQCYVHQVLQ